MAHPSAEGPTVRLGLTALVYARKLDDPELALLDPALGAAYDAMRADEDDPASPVRVERQTPLTYVPRGAIAAGVVFLHGHGGAFALPCWQIARAVAPGGAATTCPSFGADADWASARGEALVRDAIAALRGEGARRIALVGLSDGGVGATRLAPRLRTELGAVVAISGVDPSAPAPGVPALVLQGTQDRMMSPALAKAWATRVGARWVESPHGHFAFLLAADDAARAVATFVERGR